MPPIKNPSWHIRIDAQHRAASAERRTRNAQIEKRSWDVFTILATMTFASALVCCIGPWIPEQLLISAAITGGCSAIGAAATMLIMTFFNPNRIYNRRERR